MAQTIEEWPGWFSVETKGPTKVGEVYVWLDQHGFRLTDDYCLVDYDRKKGDAIWIIRDKEKATLFKLTWGGR